MLPIDFPERNRILHGPRDEQGNPTTDILDLPSYSNDTVCVCCWQLTDEEKHHLLASRSIWVFMWYGQIDPIRLSTLCPIDNPTLNTDPITLNILYADEQYCITCWEFTDDEIELMQTTSVFWFTIKSGRTQPPVGFSVLSPFIETEPQTE